MPPLLPSSGTIDMATVRSWLGTGATGMNDYAVRRVRADSKGIQLSQNPISMDDLHGAFVRTSGEYTDATGYVYSYLTTTISPASTNFNNITTGGTYACGDGSSWNGSLNGPIAMYNYGQLYVKIETGTSVVTQIYYKAYAPNVRAIRHRNSSGSWTVWEYFTF